MEGGRMGRRGVEKKERRWEGEEREREEREGDKVRGREDRRRVGGRERR